MNTTGKLKYRETRRATVRATVRMKALNLQLEQIKTKEFRSFTASLITVTVIGVRTSVIPVDKATSSPNHNYLNNLTSVLRAVTHGRHNLPGYTTVHEVGVSSCSRIKSEFWFVYSLLSYRHSPRSSSPADASLRTGTSVKARV